MNPSPSEPMDPSIPEQWEEAVVLESVHCRKCGYDLRGLRADGRCPECGFGIWLSVQHTVDPTGSRLPSIRNPRAVGNSLVVLTACLCAGMALLLLPSIMQAIEGRARATTPPSSMPMHLSLWLAAAVIGVSGVWAVRTLAPPRGAETNGTVWNDIWRVGVGFVGWLFFTCLWIEFREALGLPGVRQRLAIHLAAAVFATIGLMGLRGVLNVVGYRSREYRRSQSGRQSVDLIILAIAAGLLAAFAKYVLRVNSVYLDWIKAAQFMLWVSNLMVMIGLAYLVVNAWWIRRSLRKPPPPLDQVLAPVLPPDTWIPDREE